ncbi:MarR family winged helix-turn-helix transcriptional regulator [Tuwongella immobilis]|uniref:MarR family winged helix-turn-helix transcriptional regulator n=1 Tax=Tuwongella immobilis TaxID=692036 RepID=UPI0013A6953D|nr:MarR family winged helix-turn-helix transcriptional regulator [Tuwongella immobilis]
MRFRLLHRLLTKLYDDALRPFGLRVSQSNILVALEHHGPIRGIDLARILRLDASTLSRDLERLIAKQWVCASRGSGRSQYLEVTPLGKSLIEQTAPAWSRAQNAARDLLSESLADRIISVVDQLWASDDAEPSAASPPNGNASRPVASPETSASESPRPPATESGKLAISDPQSE